MLGKPGLFRRHEGWRAKGCGILSDPISHVRRPREPKVGKFRDAPFPVVCGGPCQQHVVGLDIAVNHAGVMHDRHGRRKVPHDASRVPWRRKAMSYTLLQALTIHPLHHEVWRFLDVAGGIHRDHVGMADAGEHLSFPFRPLAAAFAGRCRGPHHFHRNGPTLSHQPAWLQGLLAWWWPAGTTFVGRRERTLGMSRGRMASGSPTRSD